MKENRITLSMVKGKEYQLKIVDLKSDLHEDFFYNVYRDALKQVESITHENVFLDNNETDLTENSNNIIAFCGERGQGKSSAMLSFSKILNNINRDNVISWFDDLNINKDIFTYRFHVLDRIEPTELENCHNVLSIIISRMFFSFKNKAEKDNNKNIEHKNKLIKLFRQCYQDINTISKDSTQKNEYEYFDDLEQLAILSDTANIKSDFTKLVNCYLEYMYEKTQGNYLVIQIDDTDLNGNNTYNIVEAVRKYFMIPNVVILMAANLSLLIKSIENHFFKYWGNQNSDKVSYRYHPQDAYKMARQYVDKLFPGLRKINLPNLYVEDNNLLTTQITIKYIDEEKQKDLFSFNDTEGTPLKEINDIVLRYIYEKTGLVFISPVDQLHRIIPKNTRSLANFISILNSIDDIQPVFDFEEIKIDNIELRIHNLETIEEYFINNWLEENVDNSLHGYIYDWLASPLKDKNKLMLYFLNNEFFGEYSSSGNYKNTNKSIREINPNIKKGQEDSINRYFSDKIQSGRVTFYDVIKQLNFIEKIYPEEAVHNFSFAIKVLYSITLNKKYYNQLLTERFNIQYDNEYDTDLVDFVGPVLSEMIDRIIPNTRNNRSRSFITSIISRDLLNQYCTKNKSETYFTALFGDIESNSTDSVTNTENAIECIFKASYPLIRLLQPFYYINNLCKDFNVGNELKKDIFISRHTSFYIISNYDLIENLELTFIYKKYLSSDTHLLKYFTDLYERIALNLNKIKHIDLSKLNYDWLISQIESSANWITKISNSSPQREEKRSLVDDTTQQLQTFEKTYTIELLKDRLESTLRQFYLIAKVFPMIDLKFEISELENINKRISSLEKLSKKTCLKHQITINKMVKIIKEKLEEFRI